MNRQTSDLIGHCLVLTAVFAAIPACVSNHASNTSPQSAPPPAQPEVISSEPSEDAKLDLFFEEVFKRTLDRSPLYQTYLGVKTDYDKWDDISEVRAEENHELDRADLQRLHTFRFESLSKSSKISYQLFEETINRRMEEHQWRLYNYPVNQMSGLHTQAPTILISFHRVSSQSDAEAYIARLHGIHSLFQQLETNLRARAKNGIIAPKFVFPLTIESSKNLLKGQPFESTSEKDSTLLADFKKKIAALAEVSDEDKSRLIAECEHALKTAVEPAYLSLISTLEVLEEQATTDDGVWKLPRGEEFYTKSLQWTTTTRMGAEEIHNLGLSEVARIHSEMRAIMDTVGFEGDLQQFFAFMRTDPQFYYPNTDEGRAQYLKEATDIIETMKARLPELFLTFPKADLEVKKVEKFREKAAGKAFYNSPALDGSRPGYYYANLYNMSDMPTYQMEALAYHEGIPGHHMQLAIAQELTALPKFRKFGRYTAYTEGWGLYSEFIPKEMGFYEDPYSDFGRLAMELWRACRLVVDTGIHYKKWTKEEAIEYLSQNTPNPKGDITKAIQRYIVLPSQATAYKIGMIKILELREYAKKTLGSEFDIRAFHDVVLTNGPVPLTLLEKLVNEWVITTMNKTSEVGHASL